MGSPFLTIVMPIRNEADAIADALGAVLDMRWPRDAAEVLIVDGDSDDDTLGRIDETLAARAAAGDDSFAVRVISNPERIVPVAMNRAIAQAQGDVIVRIDGHCEPAPDYCERVVTALEETDAWCVGGMCETVGSDATARAIAVAQSSRVGVGNVAFRVGRAEAGPADTVPFGAFPRWVFDRVGGFDEELARNQDDEMTFRIAQAGGLVWFDPQIRSIYHSRASLRSLLRQYHQYGLFKVLVARKRGGFAAGRHVVPGAFVAAVAGAAAWSARSRSPRPLAALLAPYAAVTTAEAVCATRDRSAPWPTTLAAIWCLHFGYGTGFWRGVVRFGLLRRAVDTNVRSSR